MAGRYESFPVSLEARLLRLPPACLRKALLALHVTCPDALESALADNASPAAQSLLPTREEAGSTTARTPAGTPGGASLHQHQQVPGPCAADLNDSTAGIPARTPGGASPYQHQHAPGPCPTDFNSAFQTALDGVTDNLILKEAERFREISRLAMEFKAAALSYAAVIVAERHLPAAQKTVKPAPSLGGVAGGEKFIVNPPGILFKFAHDWRGIYGSDELAAKEAGHQLKSLTALECAMVEGLRFPMMGLIDIKGHRIVAMSLVPVSPATLLYGSESAGRTVASTSDPEVCRRIEKLASKLNLKAHRVSDSVPAHLLPADLEVHRGTDGRLYVLDFARLFPPEPPRTQHQQAGQALLTRLLRPELVRRWRTPLSSDAHTRFGFFAGSEEHDREVCEAYSALLETTIPSAARELQERWASDESAEEQRWDSVQGGAGLAHFLHARGINLRCLGRLAAHIPEGPLRAALLDEAVARCIKVLLRRRMREAVRRGRVATPVLEATLATLGAVFGAPSRPSPREGEWLALCELLHDKFPDFPAAFASGEDLRGAVHLVAVFARVREMCGLVFHARVLAASQEPVFFESAAPFAETDVLDLWPTVKMTSSLEMAAGTSLFIRARRGALTRPSASAAGAAAQDAARRTMAVAAREHFERGLTTNPTDVRIWCTYGFLLEDQFAEKRGAFEALSRAVAVDGTHARSLYYLGKHQYAAGRNAVAESLYERAIAEQPRLVNAIKDLANLRRYVRNRPDEAEALLRRALEVEPGHVNTLRAWASLLAAACPSRHGEAGAVWEKILRVAPSSPLVFAEHARFLSSAGAKAEMPVEENVAAVLRSGVRALDLLSRVDRLQSEDSHFDMLHARPERVVRVLLQAARGLPEVGDPAPEGVGGECSSESPRGMLLRTIAEAHPDRLVAVLSYARFCRWNLSAGAEIAAEMYEQVLRLDPDSAKLRVEAAEFFSSGGAATSRAYAERAAELYAEVFAREKTSGVSCRNEEPE